MQRPDQCVQGRDRDDEGKIFSQSSTVRTGCLRGHVIAKIAPKENFQSGQTSQKIALGYCQIVCGSMKEAKSSG